MVVLFDTLPPDLTQKTVLTHETKAQQRWKALHVPQISALAAPRLLQWERVWISAEMKWPTFSSRQLQTF